jgi:gluconolactonase
MMYLDAPPRLIETKVFSAMPDHYRRKGVRTDWADANRRGQPTDCFIEGPSFDIEGNLYIVDIPRLYVTVSATGTVLSADIGELK